MTESAEKQPEAEPTVEEQTEEAITNEFFDEPLNLEAPESEEKPATEVEEGDEPDEEEEESEGEESEELKPEEEEKPKKREPRWKREAERARREEAARVETERQLAALQEQNKNLEDLLKNKLSGKSEEDVTEEQKDAFLKQNGFNPDDIVDKDTVIQILQNSGKTMQSVDALRGQMMANTIQSSIVAAKQTTPDIQDAMKHFASVKSQEYKLLANQSGEKLSDEDAAQRAISAASALMISAAETGQDPAAAVYEYAKAMGYKPKKDLPKQDDIDINKLQELRDTAGKPSYNVAPVGSKGPNNFEATAKKRGYDPSEMFDL